MINKINIIQYYYSAPSLLAYTFKDFPHPSLACQVLQPVCHTRALQLWTAVYLPTSSPCTAVDDSVELYFPPSVTGDELTSRSLDRCVYLNSSEIRVRLPSTVPNRKLHNFCLFDCQTSQDTLHGQPAISF